MARVVLVGNLTRLTGGMSELTLEAANVMQLFKLLEDRFPGIRPHLEEGTAVAIDGQIYQDTWLTPIAADAEVHLMPAIGGG